MSLSDLEITPEEAVSLMKQGSTLLKCGRSGSPHFREFVLSDDLETLTWTSPKKRSDESSGLFSFFSFCDFCCISSYFNLVRLAMIKEIRLGQKTLVFLRNPLPEYEPFSFSLIYDDRTLDVVCKDKLEFTVWVTGLKSLTVDPQSLNLGEAPPSLKNSGRMTSNDRLSISFRGSQTIVSKREGNIEVFAEFVIFF